jgi:hypothetical protein
MIRKRATTSILFPWLHEDAANFNSLESVPADFNEQYRIIICTICRHALSPRQAGSHFKSKYSSLFDPATIPIIESWALATNADDKQTFDVNIRLPHPYPPLMFSFFLYWFCHKLLLMNTKVDVPLWNSEGRIAGRISRPSCTGWTTK